MFLLEEQTQKEVTRIFDHLTELLGIELFQKLFEVILTDNGHEFQDRQSLEYSKNDEYSCAVTPQVRQTGNRLSGLAGTAYASLLT